MSSVIPEGWKKINLKDGVSALVSGQSPNRKKNAARGTAFGILKTTAIDWGRFDESQNQEILDDYEPNKKDLVLKNDILITKAGPANRVGVVAIAKNIRTNVLLSGKMTAIRVNDQFISDFLSYALCRDEVQNYLQSNTTGMASSQTNFTHDSLLRLSILTPPLTEQKKIAYVLTSLDKVIENAQKQIDKLHDLKKATMNELLTKGIAHTDFQDSYLGRIPKSWKLVRLDDLVSAPICYGIVQIGEFVPKGVSVIAIKNLGNISSSNLNRTSTIIESQYKRSRVKSGDLLISIKGTVGRLDIVPTGFEGNISRDIARLRFSEKMLSEFCLIFLESSIGNRLIKQTTVGTTRAELSIHRIKEIFIPVPRITEQREIISVSKSLSDKIWVSKNYLIKIQSLKKSLMQDLLTGKVRVKI